MRGAIPPLPNTPSWRGAQLKKAQGQLLNLEESRGNGGHSDAMILGSHLRLTQHGGTAKLQAVLTPARSNAGSRKMCMRLD